ncbi:MAG: pyroglutamyl-peptidase I [Proteobacteria bacterium]|nr:pyroglutamyl-peptidase I [Pseudomonadota bacterium]
MTTPRVLLTGFEAFDGEDINPARQIAETLSGEHIGGHRVDAAVLPVSFADALPALTQALEASRPTLTICLGQAGGRTRLSIERVAINLIDARIPDNTGAQPIDTPVIADAPAAYFSTLPVKAMLAALHAAGVPAELSFSAGSYVCNAVFFALMHALHARASATPSATAARGGFIHVPLLPQQAARNPGAASMDIDTLSKGIAIAIEAALSHAHDLHTTGGSTH